MECILHEPRTPCPANYQGYPIPPLHVNKENCLNPYHAQHHCCGFHVTKTGACSFNMKHVYIHCL